MRTQNPKRDQYINDTFAQEDDHLKAIRAKLAKDGKEGINVGPYEGRLLQLLVNLVGAKKIVEVGLLYGYSTLWMARALPENGTIYSLEKSQENFTNAKELLSSTEVGDRIDLRLGDAAETLATLSSEGPFDIVFIDADKAGYLNYLNWAEENLRPGGLIIGDNSFLFGHVIGEPREGQGASADKTAIMKEFNSRLADPQKYNSVLIPTFEGMTVAQKKS